MHGASGFSLPDILVAIAVLGVGVLGVAVMQTQSHRARQEAGWTSSALHIAANLAEHVRGANAGFFLGQNYDAANQGEPAAGVVCYDAACPSAQAADFALYQAKQALHMHLPGGRLQVCRDANPWSGGRSALSWNCGGGAGAPIVVKIGWHGRAADGSLQRDRAGDMAPSIALLVPGAAP